MLLSNRLPMGTVDWSSRLAVSTGAVISRLEVSCSKDALAYPVSCLEIWKSNRWDAGTVPDVHVRCI